MIGLRSVKQAFSALHKGIRPGSVQGNVLQLGGAVIISAEGTIKYIYRSKEAGDDPPFLEIIAALS